MDTDDSGNTADSLYSDKAVCLLNFRLTYLYFKKIMS